MPFAETTTRLGRFLLELGGVPMGFLQSCDGGAAIADVVTENGPAPIQKKHVADLRFEDIVLTFGEAMDKTVFDWISSAMNEVPVPKSGAVVAIDDHFRPL